VDDNELQCCSQLITFQFLTFQNKIVRRREKQNKYLVTYFIFCRFAHFT